MYYTSVDQLGNTVAIQRPVKRIISLVPSQTELLFDLGLHREVVGFTKFCVHPSSWLKEKTIIGGTKKFDFEIIDSLQPDLIIGNKEENYQEGIEQLRSKYPVWMSDIENLPQALNMIRQVGELVNRSFESASIIKRIESLFLNLPSFEEKKALYLIWRKPWMATGTNTFIHDMLTRLKLVNVICQSRYPELTDADIRELNPEVILLSSEPFPFAEKHVDELRALCPQAKIILVDGEMFSWYGSRLQYAPAYFQELYERIHSIPTAFRSFQ